MIPARPSRAGWLFRSMSPALIRFSHVEIARPALGGPVQLRTVSAVSTDTGAIAPDVNALMSVATRARAMASAAVLLARLARAPAAAMPMSTTTGSHGHAGAGDRRLLEDNTMNVAEAIAPAPGMRPSARERQRR